MDLKASDSLSPVLRELGVPRVLAAIVTRLGVQQEISQDDRAVTVNVKTSVSTETLELLLDGTEGLLPGITGGRTLASSTWLDDEHLETRQCVSEDGRLDDPYAKLFITTRSLFDGGEALLEHCAVTLEGSKGVGATARRILRRA